MIAFGNARINERLLAGVWLVSLCPVHDVSQLAVVIEAIVGPIATDPLSDVGREALLKQDILAGIA